MYELIVRREGLEAKIQLWRRGRLTMEEITEPVHGRAYGTGAAPHT
jgi:hypothetical protein